MVDLRLHRTDRTLTNWVRLESFRHYGSDFTIRVADSDCCGDSWGTIHHVPDNEHISGVRIFLTIWVDFFKTVWMLCSNLYYKLAWVNKNCNNLSHFRERDYKNAISRDYDWQQIVTKTEVNSFAINFIKSQ